MRGEVLHREKFGWEATTHGSAIAFAFRSLFAGSDGRPVSVFLGYLKGSHGFGKAKLECLRGCQCPEPTFIDAHNPMGTNVRLLPVMYVSRSSNNEAAFVSVV